MKRNQLIALLLLLLVAWSCGNDDDGLLDAEVVPPQTVAETIVENDAEILEYLETHFYNYEEFDTPDEDFDFQIRIDTIDGLNADKSPLSAFVQSQKIPVLDDDGETTIDHTLYYIEVREGIGPIPTIGDDAFVHYEGSLLDGTVFDASTSPAVFNLSGVVRGFGNGVIKLKSGEGPIENGDGTVTYDTYGIGLIIMPSGLGYFNSPPTNIPSYYPLMFKVDLLSFLEDTDSDGDGIPSILEDLDGDGNLNNDNTDEDGESGFYLPNYNDPDDDGDGTLTIDEDLEPDSDLTVDRDGDGDKTNDLGDGNPLNDDTDGDGIPNYLDPDDSASRNGDD